jgi:hypothetical protein
MSAHQYEMPLPRWTAPTTQQLQHLADIASAAGRPMTQSQIVEMLRKAHAERAARGITTAETPETDE